VRRYQGSAPGNRARSTAFGYETEDRPASLRRLRAVSLSGRCKAPVLGRGFVERCWVYQ